MSDDQPTRRLRIPEPDPRDTKWRTPHEGPPVRITRRGGPVTQMGRAMKGLNRWARLVRRELRRNWASVLTAVVAMALFAALLYGIITHQNASRAREAKANVERVRAACGNTQAVKFKVVYGNEPSEFTDESRQWAERCYQEGR